jgi:Domain of unknown function (DUF4226)
MSTYDDVAEALKRVREATNDPNAWKTGLTPAEVSAVVAPTTGQEQLEAILRTIRQHHPDVFNPSGTTPSDRAGGDAAEAIAAAEAALAHQNTASSQLDLQVISAILNAHLKASEGREALTRLQQEIEGALRARSDLDTPTGARDFQRFLIGKLRDIRAVVADASLDDTSKAALMAAWTSLYNASKGTSDEPGEARSPAAAPAPGPAHAMPNVGADPYLDPLLAEDPDLLAGEPPAAGPAAAPASPGMPTMPAVPGFPGGGGVPASMPGLGTPGGLPLSGLTGGGIDPSLRGLDDEPRLASEEPEPKDHETPADPHDKDADPKETTAAEPPPAGPTTVTLPDGETVTAASPQLAAAIKAAANGAPIADAFRQQGITIPGPGTPVAQPIEPARVVPGDIGMFTDRHALALGHSNAILDGQIQPISTVSGPSFLGWEHPPTPAAQAGGAAPAQPGQPTPTRPAAAPAGWITAQ